MVSVSSQPSRQPEIGYQVCLPGSLSQPPPTGKFFIRYLSLMTANLPVSL